MGKRKSETPDQQRYGVSKNPSKRSVYRKYENQAADIGRAARGEATKASKRKPQPTFAHDDEQAWSERKKLRPDPFLPRIQAVTLELARRLNHEWPRPRLMDNGEPWPDDGWAMIHGIVLRLIYEELAAQADMRHTRLELAMPELFMTLVRMRGDFAEVLPDRVMMTPDYYGHVHEILVGHKVEGGHVTHRGKQPNGAHFTPSWLAAKVVDRTLERLVRCMRMGNLPGKKRILDLRVCDPAVGAGVFPIRAVRYLAPLALEDGDARDLGEAKRLVAMHCIYGVDKDRYAVLATKLALRLECRADMLPESWLDDNIHQGDALVGLNREQITSFYVKNARKPDKKADPIPELEALYDEAIDAAARARRERLDQLSILARSA